MCGDHVFIEFLKIENGGISMYYPEWPADDYVVSRARARQAADEQRMEEDTKDVDTVGYFIRSKGGYFNMSLKEIGDILGIGNKDCRKRYVHTLYKRAAKRFMRNYYVLLYGDIAERQGIPRDLAEEYAMESWFIMVENGRKPEDILQTLLRN